MIEILLLLHQLLWFNPTMQQQVDIAKDIYYEAQFVYENKDAIEEKYIEETTEQETTEQETTEQEVIEEPVEQYTTSGDLGIFSIPSAGINVGLYSDANAFQSTGKASIQYYSQYGIKWVADHVNQDGFWNLKYVSIGSEVYVNDTCYIVYDSIYAADYYSNFNSYLHYIGEADLFIQTCEGDGARLVLCRKSI